MPDSCVQLLVGHPHVDSATISRTKHLLPIKLASPVVFPILASGNVTVPGPRAPKIVKSSQLLSFPHTPHLICLQILHVLSSIYTQNLPPSPHPCIYCSGLGQYPFSPKSVVLNQESFVYLLPPRGFWQGLDTLFVVTTWEWERALLRSSGQCTGQLPITKLNVAPNVSSIEISVYINASSIPTPQPHKSVLHTAAWVILFFSL